MDPELTGKRVLVTGASRGIGKAIAKTFLDESARVAICARNAAGLTEAAIELSGLGRLAAETLGGLDVLVSNVSAMAGPDWEASSAVDVIGTDALIRTALGHMDDDTGAPTSSASDRAPPAPPPPGSRPMPRSRQRP